VTLKKSLWVCYPIISEAISLASRISCFSHFISSIAAVARRTLIGAGEIAMSTKPFIHNPETFEYYHPLEHAYLCDYLGLERPDCATGLNPHAPTERDEVLDHDEYVSDGIFRLRPTIDGEYNIWTVPNAIARMALNEHQRKLPQWSCGSADGFVKTRHYEGRIRTNSFGVVPCSRIIGCILLIQLFSEGVQVSACNFSLIRQEPREEPLAPKYVSN
jgi:hypothetical protein